jgi:hypothetical protein
MRLLTAPPLFFKSARIIIVLWLLLLNPYGIGLQLSPSIAEIVGYILFLYINQSFLLYILEKSFDFLLS